MRRLPTLLGGLGGVVLLAGAGAVFGVLPFTAYGPFELLVVAAGATALGVAVWLAEVARLRSERRTRARGRARGGRPRLGLRRLGALRPGRQHRHRTRPRGA